MSTTSYQIDKATLSALIEKHLFEASGGVARVQVRGVKASNPYVPIPIGVETLIVEVDKASPAPVPVRGKLRLASLDGEAFA